jgi:hypothetical protein
VEARRRAALALIRAMVIVTAVAVSISLTDELGGYAILAGVLLVIGAEMALPARRR